MAELTEENIEYIYNKMLEESSKYNFNPTDNVRKIARAKCMFFTLEEWNRCPCDRENEERFCCSQLCQTDVRAKNKCHCNAYKRKD